MRLVVSFAALFLSVFLVQLGSGSLGPLDALSGAVMGWSAGEIGLLGSAHFAGFFLGCWAMPRLIGGVGHSRAFAAAAAIGAIGVLLHPVLSGPVAWAALRVSLGHLDRRRLYGGRELAAGQDRDADARARLRHLSAGRPLGGDLRPGADRCADAGGLCLLQHRRDLLLPVAGAAGADAGRCRRWSAIAPTLRPFAAWAVSPLACFGIVTAGATGSSFRMVGPVFGIEYDLGQDQIALS